MRHRPSRGFSLIEVLVVIGCIGILTLMLLPAMNRVRESAHRTQCSNHLRNQAVAMAATLEAQRHFPPGNHSIDQLNHSWCSRILPFLDGNLLAREIQFRSRWDDPSANASVTLAVVDVFRCPSSQLEFAGDTDYAGLRGTLLGPGVRWREGRRSGVLVEVDRERPEFVRAKDVRDGLARTIAIAESVDRSAEEHGMWADGLGIVLQNNGRVNQMKGEIASSHPGGAHVGYADTRVGYLSESINETILAALCTKAGGEIVEVTD